MLSTGLGPPVAAQALSAMAAAASIGQSIKQRPTRPGIGVLADAECGLVADAHQGLFWHIPLTVTWAVTCACAAVVA